MRKALVLVVLVAGLAAITGFTSAGKALAYGQADAPLAQVTVSANCMNPNLCGVDGLKGGSGFWGWIEIDANGVGDAAGAGCGHLQGFGGGAGGGPGPITWEYATLETMPTGIQVLATDPNDLYYVVNEFQIAVPTTLGHYSTKSAPGITTNVTIGP